MLQSINFGNTDILAVHKKENTEGPSAATELFVERLLECQEQGWFQAFIYALEETSNNNHIYS